MRQSRIHHVPQGELCIAADAMFGLRPTVYRGGDDGKNLPTEHTDYTERREDLFPTEFTDEEDVPTHDFESQTSSFKSR